MGEWSCGNKNPRISAAKVVGSVNEALAILNKEFQIVTANKAFYDLFNTTKSEIENHSIFDLNDISMEGQELKKLFDITTSDGNVEYYEIFRSRHHRENRLLLSIRNINEPGEERLILVLVEGITKKNAAVDDCQRKFEKTCSELEQKNRYLERDLQSVFQKWRCFFDANIIGVAICSTEGTITDCNNYYLEMLGLSRNDINKGLINWNSLSAPEYRYKDQIAKEELNRSSDSTPFEKELVRKDGSRIWVECAITSISSAEVTVFLFDISDRKKFENQLIYDSSLISAIFSTKGIIIALLDASGNVIDLNQAFLEMTAFSLEEMKGRPFWQFFSEKDFMKIIHMNDNVSMPNVPVTFEKWIQSKHGEKHLINWSFAALRNRKGVVSSIIATGHDITGHLEAENRIKKLNDELRKHISELQVINDELETFSYSVSHDLKSPLSIISGFSQLIIDQYGLQLDPELVAYLYHILNSTRKMNILISDILTLSRVSRTDLIIERINLSEMVYLFLTDLQASEPLRKTEFTVQKNVEVQADRRLLHLAIENLLNNAWKYSSKEEITRIAFGSVIKDGSITYFIKDNGVGFDMKYAEKIFQPFQRLHSERDFKGTGIGLATVVRVLRRHNGRIWAESEVGNGAKFYFTLGTGTKESFN